MTAKYHINPETGNPNICRATVKCRFASDDEHYESKDEARSAYEVRQNTVLPEAATKLSLAEKLKTQEPTEVDAELAVFYYKSYMLRERVVRDQEIINKYKKEIEEHRKTHDQLKFQHRIRQNEGLIGQMSTSLEANKEKLKEAEKEMEPYESEFKRRGGWTRAFLVSGASGHVHKDMHCSTCFPSTSYQFMTDYSGHNEKEIVNDAGERACTVCYPSAPVSVLSRPTKMFTEEEKEKAKKRIEREEKRQVKEAKRKAAAITTPDGEPLKIPSGGRFTDTIKTERSAQIAAVNSLEDIRRYDKWEVEGKPYADHVRANAEERVTKLIEAIAFKRGISEKELRKDFEAKAKKKTAVYGF